MKYTVRQEADYMMGHLRYGHREGIIEAESKEDALKKLKDGYADDLDYIVDDYEIEDVYFGNNPFEIKEVKE